MLSIKTGLYLLHGLRSLVFFRWGNLNALTWFQIKRNGLQALKKWDPPFYKRLMLRFRTIPLKANRIYFTFQWMCNATYVLAHIFVNSFSFNLYSSLFHRQKLEQTDVQKRPLLIDPWPTFCSTRTRSGEQLYMSQDCHLQRRKREPLS